MHFIIIEGLLKFDPYFLHNLQCRWTYFFEPTMRWLARILHSFQAVKKSSHCCYRLDSAPKVQKYTKSQNLESSHSIESKVVNQMPLFIKHKVQ